jgi:AcrR family transcriptional regulator
MADRQMSKAEARRRAAFEQRHDQFLKLALSHFHTNGLGDITLTELAARSEFSKGTWYNHFDSSASVIISLAELNAKLQAQYFLEIVSDPTVRESHKLTSVFFDYVNHAILNPEIWTCGIVARVWRANDYSEPDPLRECLRQAEGVNQQIVIDLCESIGEKRNGDELIPRLDMVRAAAAGLCILNVVQPTYTWAKNVSAQQSIDLITAAMTQAGFEPAHEDERVEVWEASVVRTERMSADWRI